MTSSMQILSASVLSIILITISLTHVYADVYGVPNAEVIELYTNPEIPTTDEDSEITIRIRNKGDADESFKVKLYVMKGGIVKLEEYFDFELKAGEMWMGTLKFVPDSLGEHKIRAEVWDDYGYILYDAETIDMMVKSEIGPFDASLDIITTFPYPGKEMIALMTVANRGMEKMDVVVNYKIEGTDISGEYTMFLESESESSKPIFLTAPSELGLHTLNAEVWYLGSLVASSFGKFFVNPEETMPRLEMRGVPSAMKIEQGGSESLSIVVDNIGNASIHDLQIIPKGIPLNWLKRWPSFSHEVEPNGSRIFIVSLDIPEDAHAGEYPIEFISAAKEISSRESSDLVVLEALGKIEGVTESETLIYQFLGFFIGMVVAIVIIIFLFVRGRKEEDEWMRLYEKWQHRD